MTSLASLSKKAFLLILFFFGLTLNVKAQEGANVYTGDTLKSTQKTLILVPFDPMLYNSEIDRELAKHNNMNFDQIRDKFRMELDLQMGMFLKGNYLVVAPFREKDENIKKDLKKIYAGIAFNYVPLKTATGKAPKSTRSEIKNGQIVEHDNSGHKYMTTIIKDEKLIPYLNQKYGSELYLFMTQFEIKNDMSDPLAVSMGRYSRNILVHYNILNNNGETVQGGIAKTMIPTNEYDIKKLASASLREIAKEISTSIPELK